MNNTILGMKSEKTPLKNQKIEAILDGHDMNQDLHQLIGYVHCHGIETGTEGVFDSAHFVELASAFLRKHNTMERTNPKRLLNEAHTIKQLVSEHRETTKRLDETYGKLRIHEHYMDVVNQFKRHDLVGRGWDHRADEAEKIARSMELEATVAMQKPESFDDIEDDWTAKGNGTPDTKLPFGGEFHNQDARN